ncbi:MAG: phosphoenolpyruvate synthase [Planctomycetota bacterium]|jgi:pyruvate,water dikinase
MHAPSHAYVVPLDALSLDDLPRVGGKNASLGEMIRALRGAGVRVPGGFAITTDAYREHLHRNHLEAPIRDALDGLDATDTRALSCAGHSIRHMIRGAPLPADVRAEVMTAYAALADAEVGPLDVAVRSSATAEDLPTASFAGQQDSFLFVHGEDELDTAVRSCMASLFTDRAIVYRREHGIPDHGVALSVGVQQMVRSDLASAGVMFTLDTESGSPDVVTISGAWGLGELLVQGRVDPDEFWVHKSTARAGHRSVIRREPGAKQSKIVRGDGGANATREVRVPAAERRRFVLDDGEVLQLAAWAMAVEDHYSARAGSWTPMDLEWAKDGRTGELWIVQARPETVHARRFGAALEIDHLDERAEPVLTGRSVGRHIATGPVRVIHGDEDLHAVQPGDVLVAMMTEPDWNPVLREAAAVVTDHGGRTCHAAIVAREFGIPCVVGTEHATETLRSGQRVTVSCAGGDVGCVYDGTLAFHHETVDITALPEPPVPLMLNVASPEAAFHHAQLPSAGVGLMRLEFVINDWIGVHPMALAHLDRVPDPATRRLIREKTKRHDSPAEFFVDRLASGVGRIAAAFHPRPVIVRFSDFKTNEYADLLGGAAFEPHEPNPMIGFRGAARYCDDRYRDGFALECAAIRRVRDDMGLTNVKLMIPFCRTLEEGRRVIDEMAANHLERGVNGLEVCVMCEIPNNVILADQFSEIFDGFSIGTNDLTQLTLGIDRDSEILAPQFDERDPGVKRMIEMVIDAAHRHGRPVGICGQAPSDHPDFAAFLVEAGIDTISLTPDSLVATIRRLGETAIPARGMQPS